MRAGRPRLPLAAALLVLLGSTGCGRDDGRIADPPPVLPTYSGIASAGFALGGGSIQVASNGTFPRSRTLRADGGFSVPLAGLTAPYLLISDPRLNSGSSAIDAAAVTRANSGTINVTPLTRLVVLELARQDLDTYFNRLLTASSIPVNARIADFSPFTDTAIAEAQATAVRLLRQELGIVVPASIASTDWVTTPFVHSPGDPMYDTLAAFSARYARDEFVAGSYPRNRVAELARCARERLAITVGSEFYEFCTFNREALPDPGDASLLVFRLFDVRGNSLALSLRGNVVASIEFRRSGLPLYRCAESACSLVMVGGQISDQSRPLTFSNTVLTADDGSTAMLAGTVIGGIPGRPALNCDAVDGLPLFITPTTGLASGLCASADVRFEAVAGSRYIYRAFPDGLAPEVRVDGDRLLSITLFTQDDASATTPLFECTGSACSGATLGAFTSLGTTEVERVLTVSGTTLAALGGGSPVTLDGAIRLGNRIDRIPPNCAGFPASQTVSVLVSGETDSWNVCPPYSVDDGNVTGALVRDFNIGAYPGAQLGDYLYSFVNDQARSESAITVVTSPSGVVRRLQYQRSTETFACTDATCLGAVTIGPPDRNAAHVLTIAPVTVPEVLLGDRPGDRGVRLQGQLLTVSDRFFLDN